MQPKIQFIPGSKKYWVLLESITIKLTNEDTITIPEGFVWDLSSVPRFLWGILPPFGDFSLGALIHDYLYTIDYGRDGTRLTDKKMRLFADREMLHWSKQYNSSTKWRRTDNLIRYYGVRLFGKSVFKRWGVQRINTLKKKNDSVISK